MIRNDIIQAALIEYAKEQTPVLALLSDNDEIREDQWQGTEFSYPNYRLRLITQDVPNNNCDISTVDFEWQARSEISSSQQADELAGTIADQFKDKSFTRNNVRFSGIKVLDLVPAIRENTNTWRSGAIIRAMVSSG